MSLIEQMSLVEGILVLAQAASAGWLEGLEAALVVVLGLTAAVAGLFAARHGPAAWRFARARLRRGAADGLGLTAALAAVGLGFWGFIEVAELWAGQSGLGALDAAGERAVAAFASPALGTVLGAVTWLGSGWVAVPLVAALAVWAYRKRQGRALAVLLVGFGAGEALVYGLKAVFARARPAGGLHALGASFPSGHAFTATLTLGLVAYFVVTGRILRGAGRGMRLATAAGLVLLAGLVALSRVYLRAHYVTDVLGGAALAAAWLAATVAVTRLLLARGPAPADAVDAERPAATPG